MSNGARIIEGLREAARLQPHIDAVLAAGLWIWDPKTGGYLRPPEAMRPGDREAYRRAVEAAQKVEEGR